MHILFITDSSGLTHTISLQHTLDWEVREDGKKSAEKQEWIGPVDNVLSLQNSLLHHFPVQGMAGPTPYSSASRHALVWCFLESTRSMKNAKRCHTVYLGVSFPGVNTRFLYGASPFCQFRK